ncbi:MAG: microcin transporter ATP-binding protein [Rhodospirillales bacterium]|nr:microcin transporter ATP-binding protein [Rhodospirillales bacterium]
MAEPILAVRDLAVEFPGPGGRSVAAVRGVSFEIARGETLALVGESGSGKSVTALSILQLLPEAAARTTRGSIQFSGEELVGARPDRLREIRGGRIAMVFQEPMTSLNPLLTIEKQLAETLTLHKGLTGAAARTRVLELLELVGLPKAEQRLGAYPHELSGGQRQRVMIAMALANEPDLLIADEPTTALDVTIQAQILELLRDLRDRFGMALLLITHDLGVVRAMADRVVVMRKGEVVETAPSADLFAHPQHPYTRALLAAEPKGAAVAHQSDAPPVLTVEGLKVWFPIKAGLLRRTIDHVRAVDGIDLAVRPGQTVGVVGESGSGKTTLGQALLRLIDSEGTIRFDGVNVQGWAPKQLRPLRRKMQIVFQDPYGSLSPRLTVGEIVAEGLKVHGIDDPSQREARVVEALRAVGLDPDSRNRYPHEFSGGQRQRIAIARAIVLEPSFVVLDEPTSALDMSVQAQIVDLLRKLQVERGLAYLFISHDLKVVRALADEVIVMKDGRVVERGRTQDVFERPEHPYTQALLAAALDFRAVPTDAIAT